MKTVFLITLFLFQNPLNFDEYKKIKIKEEVYYMKNSGGLMFKKINDSIVRIDNSYDNKLHHESLDFIYKDEIYRLGGYGYFHYHNLMVKYNLDINEWENVEIEGLEEEEGFSFSRGFKILLEDQLLFFGIHTKNGYLPNKGYSIDLKSKRIINQLNLEKPFVSPNSIEIYDDRILILYYKKTSKLVFFDIKTEKVREKQLNLTISNSIVERESFRIENDKIIFYRKDINGEIKPLELNIDFLISESYVLNQKLYTEEDNIINYWYFLLLLIPVLVVFFKPSKKGIIIRNESVFFNNNMIHLDKKQVQIVKLLLKKSPRSNSDLNEIYMNEGVNSIHVNRVKNQNIDEINSKIQLQTGIDGFIRKAKSEIDKRMIVFHLNENIKNEIF